MNSIHLTAVVTVGLFGFASAASADKYDNDKKPEKEYKVEKIIKADRHCKDRDYKYFLPVYLKKGLYEVEFESKAYSPYKYYKYVKLDYVYVDYKDEYYEKQKEKIEDKKKYDYKETIDIPYDQYVKVYFKDKICEDNKGYGKIKFEYKKEYEEPDEVKDPPKEDPKPYDPPKEDEEDHGDY